MRNRLAAVGVAALVVLVAVVAVLVLAFAGGEDGTVETAAPVPTTTTATGAAEPSGSTVRAATTTALATATSKPSSTSKPSTTSKPTTTRPTTTKPTSTTRPATTTTRTDGLPVVALSALPKEARATWKLIVAGGPFPYERDGITFQNRERILPRQSSGYYREYTVPTPGEDDRGARRLVTGKSGEVYYTDDHYDSFRRVAVER